MVVIEDFKPLTRNTLRGFCTARFPSGLVLHEISLHVSNGKAWASPPSKPMVGSSGTALRDREGKIRYQPLVSFTSKAARDSWSEQIVNAVQDLHPDALHGMQLVAA